MHKNAVDLVGRRFGMLLVIREAGRDAGRSVVWECACDCGITKTFRSRHLVAGNSTSCGCERQRRAIAALTIHGATKSKAYQTWSSMIQRCSNPKNPRWHRYGGRGISVCARWLEFKNFLEDMGQPPDRHTLDRINNDGDYEPTNCRWTTRMVQCNNTSFNRVISYFGKTNTVTQAAREFGLRARLVFERLNRGDTPERALRTTVGPNGRKPNARQDMLDSILQSHDRDH